VGSILAIALSFFNPVEKQSAQAAIHEYSQWKAAVNTALNAGQRTATTTFAPDHTSWLIVLQSLFGLLLLVGLAVLLSENRRRIRWRQVLYGLGLQALFALIILNPFVGRYAFIAIDNAVGALLSYAQSGTAFVLQGVEPHLATHATPAGHWIVGDVIVGSVSPAIKTLAFWVLPTIIFFSALLTLLYHLGLMQWIVRGVARLMQYFMKTSGAETLSCSANVFVGQTEAPLLIRPYVQHMTRSELMAVMVGGFATVAGGVLAVYVAMLRDIPGIAAHLVTASIMAAPGALAIAKIVVPETGEPRTAGQVQMVVERPDANSIEAIARGATDGMMLVLNVTAMLIAFVAMVALLNSAMGVFGQLAGMNLSLDRVLGWALSPVAWAMGVPWHEAGVVGQLLGKKLVLTELLAYADLSTIEHTLTQRTSVIATYALCGFANIASIGIQIGGIGGIAPSRRSDLARLGVKAMCAGALVSCISAAWAGIIFRVNQGF